MVILSMAIAMLAGPGPAGPDVSLACMAAGPEIMVATLAGPGKAQMAFHPLKTARRVTADLDTGAGVISQAAPGATPSDDIALELVQGSQQRTIKMTVSCAGSQGQVLRFTMPPQIVPGA